MNRFSNSENALQYPGDRLGTVELWARILGGLKTRFFRQSTPLDATLAPGTPSQSVVTRLVLPASKPAHDAREVHAATCLKQYLTLAAQLAILLLVFQLYHLERPGFLMMSTLVVGVFLIHYWLPFRFKESGLVIASIAGAFFLLGTTVAALLLAIGLVFFFIFRIPIAYRWRMALLVAMFGALIYACATQSFPIPASFYPVFGAIFMFRIIIYTYDLGHSRNPARLLPFLSYFFLLPNYYFTLFPVIDFETMRRTYYQRDIHEIAQQGIRWMTRGTVHLVLYRVVYYFNDAYPPDRVTSLGALIAKMVLTFLLYLNVSGQFHMIVGMLHLFGYDLPETNRRYLLSSSFTDFWRRINIYWKDFMVKIVYFPIYFKLRKRGEIRAQLTATTAVFLVTWALHSYQFFWIRGQLALSWPNTIFWSILGILVIANQLFDLRHKRKKMGSSWQARAVHGVKVFGTMAIIITLWSLWSSPTLNAWVYLMTHWTRIS